MNLARCIASSWLLLACIQAPITTAAQAQAPAAALEHQPYATPKTLARLPDGRRIHLNCMGVGSPTVIFTAGMGNWSDVWRKVQPAVSKMTRACAWDRAGFGFSSGSLQAQTVANTTSDLEAALKAAGIKGPYVLVGHSLGGFESLLFADRNPGAVAGLVLVDPTPPDWIARLKKSAPYWSANAVEALRSQEKGARSCAADVKSGKVTLTSADPDGCLTYPDSLPKALTAALAKLDLNEARWAAMISLLSNFELDTQLAVNPKRNYADMPLRILTAGKADALPDDLPGSKEDKEAASRALLAELMIAHDEMAALSTRGRNERVADSSHYIQAQRPDLVIAAISDVLKELKR